MKEYLITSESVTKGHPDKVCDQISDAILDEYLEVDKNSRVAVECLISKNTLFIAGEITSSAVVDVVNVAKRILCDIGYTSEKKGFDCNKCLILTNINKQSPDIAQGVNLESNIGAGDQGIMYGYADCETSSLMPITADLANKLCQRLDFIKNSEKYGWLYPDGKAQVTMSYGEDGKAKKITSIIVSTQHSDSVDYQTIYKTITNEVINVVVDSKFIDEQTKIHINPTGRFVIGGPLGDTGLTGRKIMVDSYGGVAKHGGGAFSGKDATKVDRSGAYMARYVAKNIVAAGLAKKCEVSLAYSIGKEQPEAVNINAFGTEQIDISYIKQVVENVFSFSVVDIIAQLNLRYPQFCETAVYGHFGREDKGFKWEKTDKAEILKREAVKLIAGKLKNCKGVALV